jgi:hypothetical protein
MTVQQIADEVMFIENENERIHKLMENEKSTEAKAEYRAILRENNHQLMSLKSTLTAIRYDPLF